MTSMYPWLWLLAPLPIAVWLFVPPEKETSTAVRVPFLSRVRQAAKGSVVNRKRNPVDLAVQCVVWLLLVFACTRPQMLQPPIERTIPTRDLMLLVDLSGSMEQEDFTDTTGKRTDRLNAVKQVLGDFLVQREGDRVALVVFGNAPFLQVPFTTDLGLCRELLDETAVRMAGPRTALGDAIGLAIKLFDESDVPTKTIIALTDGNDTGSTVPPEEAAKVARDRDITIHSIAIGDPTTVGEEAIDMESLTKVSQTTGGEAFLALDRAELVTVYDRLDEIETREVNSVSYQPREDLYYWPLAAALLISIVSHFCAALLMRDPTSTSTQWEIHPKTFELESIES